MTSINLSKFVRFTETPERQRYRVGSGCSRANQCGYAIGVISLRNSPGYEVVLHLDSGKQDTFSPMRLFPVIDDPNQERKP